MLSLILSLSLAFVTGSNANVSHPQNPRPVEQNYTLAYQQSVAENKPLMVVVGAPYCPACEVLKKTTIANMSRSGELDQVSLAVVDREKEPELAKQLMVNEGMIPQIIVYTKSPDGRWNRNKLMGYQPVQPVRTLLRKVRELSRG